MAIIHNPISPIHLKAKFAFGIGTFDGVHKGHQAVIQRVIEVAKAHQSIPALVTYDNHPSTVLRPEQIIKQIYSLNQKLKLLQSTGIQYLFLYTFDKAFSAQTPEQFLVRLMQIAPFSYLNLGYDGRLGKNRQGHPEYLEEIAKRLGFILESTPPLYYKNQVVSSTSIRELIEKGDVKEATHLLGRPYSILGKVIRGSNVGNALGFPTANISVKGLALPPMGVWAVEVLWDQQCKKAVANLGMAPTLNRSRDTVLEVHIPHFHQDLYDKEMEVIFHHYIRSEKKFESVSTLQQQLRKDVKDAQLFFKS